jgi:hypothetical protein
MYYVFHDGDENTEMANVTTVVLAELLDLSERRGGFEVEGVPQPTMPDNYNAILKANPKEKTIYYEYSQNTSLTQGQRMLILETENGSLKTQNKSLENENANLNVQLIDLYEQLLEKGVL